MTDIQIVEQLLNGRHLNPLEVKRAEEIIHNLNKALESIEWASAYTDK